MGIDAKVYYGRAVVLVCALLTEEERQTIKEFLNEDFYDKDNADMIVTEESYGEFEKSLVTFWAYDPQNLFENNGWRRPLVINSSNIDEVPKKLHNGVGSEKLWEPSYENIDMLMDDFAIKDDLKQLTINQVCERLEKEGSSQNLISLIRDTPHKIPGIWMKYSVC